MKNKFTLGVIAGMAALTAAVPVISQISNAASLSSSSSTAVQQVQTVPAATPASAAISQSAAEQIALTAHPGKLSEATRNDGHFGGYKIEVAANDGNEYDVIVDATTGAVSDSWVDGQGGPKGGHMGDHGQNDMPEANDVPDAVTGN